MALPASGQITLNQVNVELGNSGTAQIGMNDAAVRGLFGIASGEIEMSDGYGKSSIAWYGSRGIIAGGATSAYDASQQFIQYYTFSTNSNASSFGNLLGRLSGGGACSDGARGVIAGGIRYNFSTYAQDTMQYITIATTGNATDFGNLIARDYAVSGLSDGTRGIFAGGRDRPGYRNFTQVISYITIATTGNASNFGNLVSANTNNYWNGMGACSNGTRGVFAGNGAYESSNIIQYITIASTGNAADFGDLTVARGEIAGCNGGDRGVFGGGNSILDYVSIPTTGNATDFGDLTLSFRYTIGGSSDNTYGVFHGGYASGGPNNTMDKITIATTGNATDFGDMTASMYGTAGLSGE